MKYLEQDIITIAKRDNNNKRPFLLVNPLQGKHLPVSPTKSLELFKTLADKVFSDTEIDYSNTLIIGFAETATAIGAGLSYFAPFPTAYIQTTRESYPGEDFLFFMEEHSHATDQTVIKKFLDARVNKHCHIIFAEDEVTTGKTIKNCIKILKKTYPDCNFTFSIASILNGMKEKKLESFKEKGIHIHFLLPVPHYDYEEILSNYTYDSSLLCHCQKESASFQKLSFTQYADTRLGVLSNEYGTLCENFAKQVTSQLALENVEQKKILILGTEEFMFPGIFLGSYMEKHTKNTVFFHATTRSPILPSTDSNYPIRRRYCLSSFYEQERTTYLYNLDQYDMVFVVTDSQADTNAMAALCGTLEDCGCDNIIEITWR